MATNSQNEKIKEKFNEYILGVHRDDIMNILNNKDPSLYYPVHIDLLDLIMSTEIQDFLTNASFYIDLLNNSLYDIEKILFDENPDYDFSVKERIVARLVSLPEAEGVFIKYPTCSDVNKLICFNGTVTKTCNTRLLESAQTYQCDKCNHEFTLKTDYSNKELLVRPPKCPNNDCQSDKFKVVEKNLKNVVKDYQEIKLQEKLDVYSAGTIPRSIVVILENDLVDCCKPGDDVTINAVVIRRWGRLINDMRCDIDLILYANYVKVNNEEQTQINITKEKEKMFQDFWKKYEKRPLTGRNIILSSYCPQLYGMYIVKLAVSLVLTGGVSRSDSSGTRVRGESHLLLVGDPGTGKSQFLKYANKIIPKSILTTGIGSSSAGLTATASREGGIWHLEAGALVLADGGICCVDEFNCMKEQEKMSMLEAMEQQSISVAKAGIVCKLRTQCSVLAACNPKGPYDSNQPVTVNLAMSSPLLSRFDVILLLLDTPNKEWDNLASTFLLEGIDLLRKNQNDDFKVWDFDQLRLYLNYVKSLEPSLTPSANIVIQKYYQLQRRSDDRNAARTTVRMLESIIRLSQAHAKLMLRNEVIVMDAVVSITLIECSINRTASFGNVNILHTSFPEDAEIEYKNQAELILTRLELGDILAEELRNIEETFEPFEPSQNKQKSNTSMNMTLHHFDIVSQMVKDIPTQKLSSYSNTKNHSFSNSFVINSKHNSNKSVLINSQVEEIVPNRFQEINNVMNNETSLRHGQEKENLEADQLENSKKRKLEETLDETKSLYEESLLKKNKVYDELRNAHKKSMNQSVQMDKTVVNQTQLKTQAKSQMFSAKLSQAVNVKNLDIDDVDLTYDD